MFHCYGIGAQGSPQFDVEKTLELPPFGLIKIIVIMLQIMEGLKDTKMHKNKG